MGRQIFIFSGSSFLVRGEGTNYRAARAAGGPRVGWGWYPPAARPGGRHPSDTLSRTAQRTSPVLWAGGPINSRNKTYRTVAHPSIVNRPRGLEERTQGSLAAAWAAAPEMWPSWAAGSKQAVALKPSQVPKIRGLTPLPPPLPSSSCLAPPPTPFRVRGLPVPQAAYRPAHSPRLITACPR